MHCGVYVNSAGSMDHILQCDIKYLSIQNLAPYTLNYSLMIALVHQRQNKRVYSIQESRQKSHYAAFH